MLLHRWLSEPLELAPHICKNTQAVIYGLDKTKFEGNMVLVKADVMESFMSGAHGDLIAAVLPHIEYSRRRITEPML